jgi:4-amino-4-deoxy-L-arabinose transferase-like glycosyltransferase
VSADVPSTSLSTEESAFDGAFWRLWWLSLAVKTVIAVFLPLANDEAYYWVWGHHPALSYFDHPPMVAWLFSIGTLLESFANAARLPGVWLGHATLLIWNQILQPFIKKENRSTWLIFVVLSPFFGIGSLIITPDVPLLFFWSLSLLLLLRSLKFPTAANYVGLGLALGLGFCSKYLIVLFVPIALIWLMASGNWRRVRWSLIPLTVLFGMLACLPVLIWNYQHQWASFEFQLHHGLDGKNPRPSWPFEYLGAQIGLLFPIVIVFAWFRREKREASFLHYFGWLPLLFFFTTSFRARVEANWPTMAHPEILSLAFLNMTTSASGKRWLKAMSAIWALAITLVLAQLIHPWIPLSSGNLKTSEFTRFDPVAEAVAAQVLRHEVVYLGSYQMAAAVSYKLKTQLYKLAGLNRRDFYDFQSQSIPESDRFFLGAFSWQELPSALQARGYVAVNTMKISDEFKIVEVQRRAKDSDR